MGSEMCIRDSQKLMRQMLREEMGFDGVLISDYAAILETVAHGASSDKKDAAHKALLAGVDIDMMTGCYAQHHKLKIRYYTFILSC